MNLHHPWEPAPARPANGVNVCYIVRQDFDGENVLRETTVRRNTFAQVVEDLATGQIDINHSRVNPVEVVYRIDLAGPSIEDVSHRVALAIHDYCEGTRTAWPDSVDVLVCKAMGFRFPFSADRYADHTPRRLPDLRSDTRTSYRAAQGY